MLFLFIICLSPHSSQVQIASGSPRGDMYWVLGSGYTLLRLSAFQRCCYRPQFINEELRPREVKQLTQQGVPRLSESCCSSHTPCPLMGSLLEAAVPFLPGQPGGGPRSSTVPPQPPPHCAGCPAVAVSFHPRLRCFLIPQQWLSAATSGAQVCDLLPLSGAQPWGWEVSLSLPFLPKVLSSPHAFWATAVAQGCPDCQRHDC